MSTDGRPQLRMRRRILAAVQEFPGIHLRALARHLDVSLALVEYHVPFMVDNGLLETQSEASYVRLYAKGKGAPETPQERQWMAVLRQPNPLHIVLTLLDVKGPLRHAELTDMVQMGKSKVSFHLRKLQQAGVVIKTDDGAFALGDRGRVSQLLHAHPPTPDLTDRFASTWAKFYDS